jgi:hypothetical protein
MKGHQSGFLPRRSKQGIEQARKWIDEYDERKQRSKVKLACCTRDASTSF